MSANPSITRVKLRTTSRRVPRARIASADIEEPPEPTMRLSRAILVMLLLHIVAVGGFFASSVLRERDFKRTSGDPSTALEAEDSMVLPSGEGVISSKHPRVRDGVRPNIHVVRPGETLTLIANENGVTLEALVAANGAEVVTTGLLTGQELKLPERSPEPSIHVAVNTTTGLNPVEGHAKNATVSTATVLTTPSKTNRPSTPVGKFYVVGKGENAYNIAQKNNVSYDALLKLNQIADPKKLQTGQKLRMPVSKSN